MASYSSEVPLEEMLNWFSHMQPLDIPSENICNNVNKCTVPLEVKEENTKKRFVCHESNVTLKKCYKDDVYKHKYNNIDLQSVSAFSYGLETVNTSNHGDFSILNNHEFWNKYKKYNFNRRSDNLLQLPIHRNDRITKICDEIENNSVVIIEGATGCGKTTQIPQAIVDYRRSKNLPCRIIVTQPRRIAAITIAERVCHERKWPIGTVVGYQIGTESVYDRTLLPCIMYVTTGVLLNRLIRQKDLNEYTHIILDEIHERDIDIDFCMLIVRKLLHFKSPDVKIILMSATMKSCEISKYFFTFSDGIELEAKCLEIFDHLFNVSTFYLDDLSFIVQSALPKFDIDKPEFYKSVAKTAFQLICYFDKLNTEDSDGGRIRKAVLVFLPGKFEIKEMIKLLGEVKNKFKWSIITLHSEITTHDQRQKIFDRVNCYERKIILSTNIAESSITIPDIGFIIDFCLTRYNHCDKSTNITSLALEWASKSSCKQRQGRAGRVEDGRCYRLVTKEFYLTQIPEETEPEMVRVSLEQLVLKSKSLENETKPSDLLGLALSPPNLDNIVMAILSLKELGAMYNKPINSTDDNTDGEVTYLGKIISKLPIDVKLGKLIMMGYAFGLMEDAIIIAVGLATPSIFITPLNGDIESYEKKLKWSDNQSDCITTLEVYKNWKRRKMNGEFGNTANTSCRLKPTQFDKYEIDWAREQFLQLKQLYELDMQIEEIKHRLHNQNFEIEANNININNSSEYYFFVKLMLAAAFYPNYLTSSPIEKDNIGRELSNCNPLLSCVLRGIPYDEGMVYSKIIEDQCLKLLHSQSSVVIDGSKAIIQFSDDNDRKFPLALYKALKLGSLNRFKEFGNKQFCVYSLSSKERQDFHDIKMASFANSNSLSGNYFDPGNSTSSYFYFPSDHEKIINIFPHVVISCGEFWASNGKVSLQMLEKITNQLNNMQLESIKETDLKKNMLCAARFSLDFLYYRAKILNINYSTGVVEIFFIDFGNNDKIKICELKKLPESLCGIKNIAMYFKLANVSPKFLKYTQEDKESFMKMLDPKRNFFAEIYAIVDDKIMIKLFQESNMPTKNTNINEELIKNNICKFSEEDDRIVTDHERRETIIKSVETNPVKNPDTPVTYNKNENVKIALEKLQNDIKIPNPGRNVIYLKGPSNPLQFKFNLTTNIGFNLPVNINTNSVNSICLNDSYVENNQRLMVASSISISHTNKTIRVHDTTLLPNIPGLPILCHLLFAPRGKFHTNKRKTSIVAILGLGCEEDTFESIYPENDIHLEFDYNVSTDDLQLINKARYALSGLIDRDGLSILTQSNVTKLQTMLRDVLCKLFKRIRQPLPNNNDRSVIFDLNKPWKTRDNIIVETSSNSYDDYSDLIFPLYNELDL